MNEFELLKIFYEEMKAQGTSRDNVFLSIDDNMLAIMRHKFGEVVRIEDIQVLADICIANEWMERTTADPYYNFLSLTDAGLQIVILREYKTEV